MIEARPRPVSSASRPLMAAVAVIASIVAVAAGARAGAAERSGAAPGHVAAGRFVVHGTAHANATGLPARSYPLDALVLVAPGGAKGSAQLHLRARGYACDLLASATPAGALTLAPGQTCRVEVRDPEWNGHVDARLREGSGHLSDRRLSLSTTWDLSGSLSRPATVATVPGTSIEVPLPATPGLPVRGTLEASASGSREEVKGG